MTDTYYAALCRRLRNRRVCIQETGGLEDHSLMVEAAKAIESAVGEAQEAWKHYLNNVPRWIHVSEKFPVEGEHVLLYADDDEIYIGWFVGFQHGVPIFENDEYQWDGVVTHWQKLPGFPRYCASCKHYMGMGDWSLCCDLKHDLCYENTPACSRYEKKEVEEGEE